jgi:hypothetical protein
MQVAAASPASGASSRATSHPSPLPIHTKSFSRLDSSGPNDSARSRSSLMSAASPTFLGPEAQVASPDKEEPEDVFDRGDDTISIASVVSSSQLSPPQTFEELPIEIRSLTERCVAADDPSSLRNV